MKSLFLASLFVATAIQGFAAQADERFFEMRTYYAAPGKLEDLQARFRNHTTKLFAKHGMENIGYWVPVNNPDNKLIYILAYPSREARERAWKAFGADPAWQEAAKASEKNGRLVARADSVFLKATDFSPVPKAQQATPERLFELRTYKASPGKLDALLARFRDHTKDLFARHGMTQIGYWVPTESKDGSADTLIYILAHKDQQAMENSFKAFRADPDWVKAKADSEKDGPLTIKDGVQSVPMKPADYSPLR